MTNVVSLAERRGASPRRQMTEPVTAQILLFTGIRYERLETVNTKQAKRLPRAKNK